MAMKMKVWLFVEKMILKDSSICLASLFGTLDSNGSISKY
jgi:hypothetical protein